jgi:hypothetical protein
MKVIHLPVNISSQISTTVRALRSLGVEARGLARNFSPIQDHAGLDTVDWFGTPKPAARLWRGIRWRWKLVRALGWADVVHWHWGDSTWKEIDLRLAARLGKARLVEFWGDDLREPERASRDNPFLARMYRQHPELANQRSQAVQQMFRRHGFACLIPGYELADYLHASSFPGYYQTRQRLLLSDYTPHFPDPEQNRPVLVHAPSDKARKGTEAVLVAIASLQKAHSFEFKLIHQMPRTDALATVASADLFLDQFTVGAEGLAALEAMALGKPVVCFIKGSLQSRYPTGLPIVVTDQERLAEVIAPLVGDGARRRELGINGRNYVEAHHDARKLAAELVEIYEDLSFCNGKTLAAAPAFENRHWRSLPNAKAGTEACVP